MVYRVDFDHLRQEGWPIDSDATLPPEWWIEMDSDGTPNTIDLKCQVGSHIASITWSPTQQCFQTNFDDTPEKNGSFGSFAESLALAIDSHGCKKNTSKAGTQEECGPEPDAKAQ